MTNKRIFYVTKYALTRGPFAATSEAPFMKSLSDGDFYLDKQDAITDCERRRHKEIESLKIQIAKLEKMEFKL